MPTIRWLGPGVFTDHRRGFELRPDTEHDLDEDTAEEFLNHDQFAHRFERVDGGSEGATESSSADGENSGEDTSDATEDGSGDEDICGTVMSDGDVCERPADECPYHDNG